MGSIFFSVILSSLADVKAWITEERPYAALIDTAKAFGALGTIAGCRLTAVLLPGLDPTLIQRGNGIALL